MGVQQETALQAARQEVEEAAKEKRTSVDDVNQVRRALLCEHFIKTVYGCHIASYVL